MASEPDNLVLVQLREMRVTLAEHSAQFAQMNERFDQLDKRFEDFHAIATHTLHAGYIEFSEIPRAGTPLRVQ